VSRPKEVEEMNVELSWGTVVNDAVICEQEQKESGRFFFWSLCLFVFVLEERKTMRDCVM
jgi:hypothetical protein